MRDTVISGFMQDQAIQREYDKAIRMGATDFAKAVRFANPHLNEEFNQLDAIKAFEETRTANDGKCLGQVAKEANAA